MLQYYVNSKIVKIPPHVFEGKLSIENYENQIYSALSKIGVTKEYVEIKYSSRKDEEEDNAFAQVKWIINLREFMFECFSQATTVSNLGCIAQAIQEDIRQITRGIKDLDQIMNQYKPRAVKPKKKNLLHFESKEGAVDEMFPVENNLLSKPVNEELDEEFAYLNRYDNEELDAFYFNFKEQCLLKNTPDHPRLKAFKIVRQRSGLRL